MIKKTLSCVAVAATISAMVISSPAMAAKKAKMNDSQKLGYTIGVQLGTQFKAHGIKLDSSSLEQGFNDAYAGSKTKMTEKEMTDTMNQFRQKAAAKQQKQVAEQAKVNLDTGDKYLKANSTKAGVKVTKSGLQYKVIKKGTGPKPTADDVVKVQYEGKLVNGKVFDSSYKRGKPAEFPVSGVIPGWTEALKMMHKGATWMVFIPAKLAYGERGAPMGGIGPNETLTFKVQLVDIIKKDKKDKKSKK